MQPVFSPIVDRPQGRGFAMHDRRGRKSWTILLMGVVSGVEGSGVVDDWVAGLRNRTPTPQRAEWWIFGAISGAVVLIILLIMGTAFTSGFIVYLSVAWDREDDDPN